MLLIVFISLLLLLFIGLPIFAALGGLSMVLLLANENSRCIYRTGLQSTNLIHKLSLLYLFLWLPLNSWSAEVSLKL